MDRLRAAYRTPRSEEGFALIEVIVSAAVLALLAVTVLAGIDGASSSTGREKSRSIAANLAERDQERMRSMQADTLAAYTETRTVDVDGSSYTVESEGRWVTDATGGTPSCANDSDQADYLQISSRVTNRTVGTRTRPVEIESLVAPSVAYNSTRGALAVQVKDRDGVGVAGLAVTITGPSSHAGVTNQDGCAVFLSLPVGNYSIQLNRPGWVDHYGNTAAVGNQDVTSGTLNVRTIDYDVAGSAVATVGTYRPGSTTPAVANLIPSFARRMSAVNGGEPGMQRLFEATPAGTRFNQITLGSLFPFKEQYGLFTGGCPEASPVLYDPDYYPNYTGSVLVDRAQSPAVTVRQPPFNIRIQGTTAGTYIDHTTSRPVRIFATLVTTSDDPAEPACAEPVYPLIATGNNLDYAPGHAAYSGWVSQAPAPDFDPGMPFGTYNLCIDWQTTATRWRRYVHNGYDNTQPFGRPATLTLPPAPGNWSSESSNVANRCAA
jgi:type II secretory pathway pseudopilin PulG